MRWLLSLVSVSFATVSAAGGTTTISRLPSSRGLTYDDCRFLHYGLAIAKVMNHSSGANPAQLSHGEAVQHIAYYCAGINGPCPAPKLVDVRGQCSSHSVHTFASDFGKKLSARNSMMWQIFFLVFALIFGAFFRMVLPKWLPYTVGLLLVGIIVGAMAQYTASRADCPMYALQHDADGDGYISEAEYKHFICEGCSQESFCIAAGRAEPFKDKYFSTCGDGSAKPPSHRCWYTFDWLDSPWKLSSMHAESKFAYPDESSGSSHRRRRSLASSASGSSGSSGSSAPLSSASLSLGRAAFPAGDGKLSADELWTTRCNLLIDMISLKDIDPHMMLVIFLPALLYESAAFGVDMGIFLKQLPQILILAFPAMVTASLLTAVMLYALAPASWSFWVCWLIGVIASATDPVAVVALLKDLGAAKSLGTLIEGESLLNDASAVVLYVFVKNLIGYDHATQGPPWMLDTDPSAAVDTRQWGFELLRVVANMAFFGVVLGIAFGYATKTFLRFVYNDQLIEGSVVFAASYICFWVGEVVTGSSAVLAVVIMWGCTSTTTSRAYLPTSSTFCTLSTNLLHTRSTRSSSRLPASRWAP